MRYYTIVITDPKTNTEIRRYTSLTALGQNNPGALNIELDANVYALDAPIGAATVKIWGIGIEEIGAAFDLNEKRVQVYAGMSRGLPLANPTQAGLILSGMIQQAFGNWEGVNMSLDLIVNADSGTQNAPKNIVLNWKKGQKLADAIRSTLSVAFPDFTSDIQISDKLVLNQDEHSYYQSALQFAKYIKEVSQHIMGGTYRGVAITIKENGFVVYDGSTQKEPKSIVFTDLIGQPTWLGLGQIQFKCVMRADLQVSDFVTLPRGQATTTAQSYSQFRKKADFQGSFMLDAVRHVGNFRQADAASWVTVFNAHVP